jgi:hypothetical protein
MWLTHTILNQSKYTTAISDRISTHERGHAQGFLYKNEKCKNNR